MKRGRQGGREGLVTYVHFPVMISATVISS